MASPALPTTAEALLTSPLPAAQVELVRGQVVVREPPGQRHGSIVGRMHLALALHLREERRANGWTSARGRLIVGDAGYILERQPDTVRGPDVAYLSRARYDGALPDGYLELAPDLVVEVRSPHDRPAAVSEKVTDWLRAGVQLVWVVDPARLEVVEYAGDGTVRVMQTTETLDGGVVLPNFVRVVGEIFADE
jgi:Uma2 family endonuclease